MTDHDPKEFSSAGERAEIHLRESEEHFSQLVAGVRDYAVFLLDRAGHIMTWNAGAEHIKGYRDHEILGQHFSRFYTEDAISSGWPAHELRVAAATGRFEDEGWRVRRDGTCFWADVVLTALREKDGEVRGFLKITRDLTDRKQAEEKLRLSEERFRILVDGVKDYAIFMLDPEGRVATWNNGAEQLKGYRASEIVGRHFSTFYPQDALDRGWPGEELRLAAQDGRLEDEGWRLRKDGSRFWANVVLTALRDESGHLLGFAKVTRDLSERREAEERQRLLIQEEAARKAAEEAAQEIERQKEQLRVTLASIGDGVVVTDGEGRVTFLNKVAEGLTGWSVTEAAGQPLETIFEIVHESTRETIENPGLTALREGTVQTLANHTVLIRKGGGEIPIEDSAAPIVDSTSQISGVVLVFRDVTEARRSLQTRLYLASIVESSDDAIIGKELDGRIASWNKAAERLYGYEAQEMIGQPLLKLVPPERRDELDEIMRRVGQGERLEHYVTERIRKDGARVPVSLTISPVKDQTGRTVGVSKIGRDISAQVEAERRQREQSDRFRLLWESAAVLLTTDAPDRMLEGLFAKIAPHLQLDAYFHYQVPESGEGLHLASYVSLTQDQANAVKFLAPGQGISGQVALTRQPAVYSDIGSSVDPAIEHARTLGLTACVCNPLIVDDRLLGTLAFASRLRKDFEPGEVEFLRTLSQYVAAAYERLRLVEQLREADRRKDHFLATLAHELRNPLAPIRNGLEVMKLAEAGSPVVARAQMVMERQLGHMVRLIDDLLDVSRISQGKVVLRKTRIPVSDAVQAAAETSRPLLEANRHTLEIHLPDQLLYVDADMTRLSQVLSNLLNNAAKFTRPGGLIQVEVRREGDEVALSVRDNGVGIPQAMLPQVFEVFTQVDRSLERSDGGLGIGLSLVKGLTELHGGRVQARSEGEEKGTEFLLHLPLAAAGEPAGTAVAGGEARSSSGGGLRVLVVDDNQDSAMTLSLMLEMMHHQVAQAHDGRQAVEAAATMRPQLILMDIGMPGMNGYDACREIRAQEWGKSITIVALTGWGQEEDRRHSSEAGFNSHLVKPVDPADLQHLVSSVTPHQA